MFEIVGITYKELHYQLLKRNPRVSEEKRIKAMEKISIKRNLIKMSFFYLFFGAFLASGAFSADKTLLKSLSVTIATLPFVFALYATVVNSSHSLTLSLFQPLRALPLRLTSFYLSGLLLLDIAPTIAIAIPSVVAVAVRYPSAGILLFLWALLGILIGHTLGLLILSIFGLKISYKRRKQVLRNFLKVIGLILVMSAFYAFNYLQKYLNRYAGVFERYAIAFPFSATSIFEAGRSLILLAAYTSAFLILYHFSLNRAWRSLLEPPKVESEATKFAAGFGGVILALAIKDLRLIFRKGSALAGMLIPLYFILPQLFMILRTGSFPKELVIVMIAVISFFSSINADILLRIEGREIDFLRTLPLDKRKFGLAKAVSMFSLPAVFSAAIVFIGAYFDRGALLFLAHAFLMPFDVSLLSTIYLFHYEGEEIGIPEKGLLDTLLILAIDAMLVGIISLPLVLIPFPGGFALSLLIAIAALVAMVRVWK